MILLDDICAVYWFPSDKVPCLGIYILLDINFWTRLLIIKACTEKICRCNIVAMYYLLPVDIVLGNLRLLLMGFKWAQLEWEDTRLLPWALRAGCKIYRMKGSKMNVGDWCCTLHTHWKKKTKASQGVLYWYLFLVCIFIPALWLLLSGQ